MADRFRVPDSAIHLDLAAAGINGIKVNVHEVDFLRDPNSSASYSERPIVGVRLTVAQVEPDNDNAGATFSLDIVDPEAAALYDEATMKFTGSDAAKAAIKAWLRRKYRIVPNATVFGLSYKPEDVRLSLPVNAYIKNGKATGFAMKTIAITGTPAVAPSKPEGK